MLCGIHGTFFYSETDQGRVIGQRPRFNTLRSQCSGCYFKTVIKYRDQSGNMQTGRSQSLYDRNTAFPGGYQVFYNDNPGSFLIKTFDLIAHSMIFWFGTNVNK